MADNEIRFLGNAEQLLKEYEKLEKKEKEKEAGLKKSAKAARDANREQQQLEREAERIRQKNLTDLEKHQQSLRQLDNLKKQGKLSEEDYQKALAREREEYRQNTAEFKESQKAKERLRQEEEQQLKEVAEEQRKFHQEGKRLAEQARTPLERYNQQIEKLDKQLKAGNLTVAEHARLTKLARNSYREATAGTHQWGASIKNIAVMMGAGGILMGAFAAWKRSNQEIIDQASEIGKAYDEAIRKFSVQAGLQGLQLDEADQSIQRIAEKNAVPVNVARSVSTQLVSSGFSAKEAYSGSLDTFLQIMAASNANGQNMDPAELAKALTQFLSANDLQKNAGNVAKFGIGTQRLFKSTNLQLSALPDFANAAAAVSGQITPEEQLASAAAIVDVMDASKGATGLRNTVGRLAGAAANPSRVAALNEVGLDVGDVDFVGEDLVTVLRRVKAAIQSLPEEQQKAQRTRIFGEEGEVAAAVMLQKVDAIEANLAIQQDVAGFQQDVQIATTGRNAASTRQQLALERQLIELDQEDDLLVNEMKLQIRASGRSNFSASLAGSSFRTLRSLGVSPELAAANALGFSSGDQRSRVSVDTLQRGVAAAESGDIATLRTIRDSGKIDLGSALQALRENTAATKENSRQANRNQNPPQLGNDRRQRGQ